MKSADASSRLFLLEIVNATDRFRNFRSKLFPFVQALARQSGVSTRWGAVRGMDDHQVFDLDIGDTEHACEAIARFGATHVLVNERIGEQAWRTLRSALPDVAFRMVLDDIRARPVLLDVAEWMGLDRGPLLDESTLPTDTLVPDFTKVALCEGLPAIKPPLFLIVGPMCVYGAPLHRNPLFDGVDVSRLPPRQGCSFCFVPDPVDHLPRTPVVDLAMAQILAAEKTAPMDIHCRNYVVHGVTLWFKIDRFLAALAESKLPPSVFYFSSRIDELTRMKGKLDAALPLAERLGHQIRFFGMSIESFSEVEQLRFNKGLSRAAVEAGIACIRDLEERFPTAFNVSSAGELGFILWTPWTRVEDLRINLEATRRYWPSSPHMFIDRVLQLFPGLALTELARRDGLTIEAPADHRAPINTMTAWDEQEIPWRFQHEEVGLLCRLWRRLVRSPEIPADDPELELVARWFDKMRGRGCDIARVFDLSLAEITEDPAIPTLPVLLDRIARRAPGASAPAPHRHPARG